MSNNTSEPIPGSKQPFRLGCGSVAVILIVALVIGLTFFGGPDVKISNGVAHFREQGSWGYVTPEMVGTKMVAHVYEIATKHPEVQKIVVDIYYTKQDVADKYGREPDGDVVVGSVTIDDVAEVRRYKKVDFYSAQVHGTFAAEIRRMSQTVRLKP